MTAPIPKMLEPHIEAGHDLFPLNKGEKTPRDKGWQTNDYSRQDPRKWMEQGFNVGVRLHRRDVVLDFDPRNSNRSDLASEFFDANGIDPADHFRVETGTGLHLYARKLEELDLPGQIEGWQGIDVLTEGRFVVASGSVHPNGRLYRAVPDWLGSFKVEQLPTTLVDVIAKRRNAVVRVEAGELDCDRLGEMLDLLDPEDYGKGQHDKWLELAMACHHATGGAGADVFAEWCARDPSYSSDGDKVHDRWNSFDAGRKGGVTCKTLYKAVIDAGGQHLVPRPSAQEDFAGLPVPVILGPIRKNQRDEPKATLHNCIVLVDELGLGLAYDELAQRPMMRAEALPWRAHVGRELNDETFRQVRVLLTEKHGVEFTKELVADACLFLASNSRFNPVTEYLDTLNWDGAERIDDWLSAYLGAERSDYSKAVGRATLIAAVRRARNPGCKFDTVLILEGAQGTGKSSALRALGGDWHSDAELGRVDGKDAAMLLQNVWLHELGEINAFNHSETEALKAFVSRQEDRFRAPYDRVPRTEKRRCIFVGTTNSDAYLRDSTGNRRFWPVETGAIDLAALRRDRDQIWAEASHWESLGEAIELPSYLWESASEQQAARLIEDPWGDRVRRWLATVGEPSRVFSRDVIEGALRLEAGQSNRQAGARLREVMRSLGWRYRRGLRIGAETCSGYERDPDQRSLEL